jgi:hypothetical protein
MHERIFAPALLLVFFGACAESRPAPIEHSTPEPIAPSTTPVPPPPPPDPTTSSNGSDEAEPAPVACLSSPRTDAGARPPRVAAVAGESGPYRLDLVVCTRAAEGWNTSEIRRWSIEAVLGSSAPAAPRAIALRDYETDVFPHARLGPCVVRDSSAGVPPPAPARGRELARCDFYTPGAHDFFVATHRGSTVEIFAAEVGETGGRVPYTLVGSFAIARGAEVEESLASAPE